MVAAVNDYDPELPLLCLPGSVLAQLAQGAGLRVVAEGFADRNYLPNGQLVPRTSPDALVTDPHEVARRAVRMATEQTVVAIDGSVFPCVVDSICLHGDSPGAVAAAELVRAALIDAGATPTPFT